MDNFLFLFMNRFGFSMNANIMNTQIFHEIMYDLKNLHFLRHICYLKSNRIKTSD